VSRKFWDESLSFRSGAEESASFFALVCSSSQDKTIFRAFAEQNYMSTPQILKNPHNHHKFNHLTLKNTWPFTPTSLLSLN
jgi:uncharacterized protein YktA (UPF0223 family)